jgi:hypothetical protein
MAGTAARPAQPHVTGYPKAHGCGDSGAILSIIEQDICPHCGPGRAQPEAEGGLFLLVLPADHGLYRVRAREKTAITRPAPEKVAANRGSSSRARLSAPPRSKPGHPDDCETQRHHSQYPQEGEEQEDASFSSRSGGASFRPYAVPAQYPGRPILQRETLGRGVELDGTSQTAHRALAPGRRVTWAQARFAGIASATVQGQ